MNSVYFTADNFLIKGVFFQNESMQGIYKIICCCSIHVCSRNKRLFIVSGSSDCSVALWDMKGNRVGEFGQEQHWKLDLFCQAHSAEVVIEEDKEEDQPEEQLFEVRLIS